MPDTDPAPSAIKPAAGAVLTVAGSNGVEGAGSTATVGSMNAVGDVLNDGPQPYFLAAPTGNNDMPPSQPQNGIW